MFNGLCLKCLVIVHHFPGGYEIARDFVNHSKVKMKNNGIVTLFWIFNTDSLMRIVRQMNKNVSNLH